MIRFNRPKVSRQEGWRGWEWPGDHSLHSLFAFIVTRWLGLLTKNCFCSLRNSMVQVKMIYKTLKMHVEKWWAGSDPYCHGMSSAAPPMYTLCIMWHTKDFDRTLFSEADENGLRLSWSNAKTVLKQFSVELKSCSITWWTAFLVLAITVSQWWSQQFHKWHTWCSKLGENSNLVTCMINWSSFMALSNVQHNRELLVSLTSINIFHYTAPCSSLCYLHKFSPFAN